MSGSRGGRVHLDLQNRCCWKCSHTVSALSGAPRLRENTPPLCEAGRQWKKAEFAAARPTAAGPAVPAGGLSCPRCPLAGRVRARRQRPARPGPAAQPRARGAEAEASLAPKGGSRLERQGSWRESGAAGHLPLAKAAGRPRPAPPSPAKSLYPALNLMTQIRALKVFATDCTCSFINHDLHIDA